MIAGWAFSSSFPSDILIADAKKLLNKILGALGAKDSKPLAYCHTATQPYPSTRPFPEHSKCPLSIYIIPQSTSHRNANGDKAQDFPYIPLVSQPIFCLVPLFLVLLEGLRGFR